MNSNELSCDILVLIPTRTELDCLSNATLSDASACHIELCGFGPIVSAARTVQLIEQWTPKTVVLLGIAGSYQSQLKIGTAFEFGRVACYGVGVGQGNLFRPANEMGWKQWAGDKETPEILDVIELCTGESNDVLLTVCSAAANRSEVEQRINFFEDAVAEDMEGFGVAAACRLAGVPLRIIRGISNLAGDRDCANWKIDEAMKAAWQMLLDTVKS